MNRGTLVYKLLESCDSILDVGCASGYYTKLYSKKCKKIIGIDPNKDLIEKAREENPRIEFIKASAEKLPFGEEKFGIVIMSEVLEHVEDEIKSLEEIYRVLKRNGKLIITVPNKGLFGFLDVDNYSWYARQFKVFYKFIHKLKGRDAPKVREGYSNKHKHYSLGDLKKLLINFRILEYKRNGLIMEGIGDNLEVFFRWVFNKNIKLNKIKYLDFGFNFGKFASSLIIVVQKK